MNGLRTELANRSSPDASVAPRGIVGPGVRVFSKDTFELGRGEFKVGEGFAIGLYSPERSLVVSSDRFDGSTVRGVTLEDFLLDESL